MRIAVGSTNPVKVGSVIDAFTGEYEVLSCKVPSGVSAQPFSEEETRQGAENRAKAAMLELDADLGIGLEGGLYIQDHSLFLCHWAVLYQGENKIFSTNGPRILLPNELLPGLRAGKELGEVMEEYTGIHKLGTKRGAIGIFTQGIVNRQEMFSHLLRILKGQFDFYS